MNLFDIFLRIIKANALTSTEDYQTLHVDVKEWEKDAIPESENKVKALYGKLHQGILFRVLAPFLYFFLLAKVRNIMQPREEEEFYD